MMNDCHNSRQNSYLLEHPTSSTDQQSKSIYKTCALPQNMSHRHKEHEWTVEQDNTGRKARQLLKHRLNSWHAFHVSKWHRHNEHEWTVEQDNTGRKARQLFKHRLNSWDAFHVIGTTSTKGQWSKTIQVGKQDSRLRTDRTLETLFMWSNEDHKTFRFLTPWGVFNVRRWNQGFKELPAFFNSEHLHNAICCNLSRELLRPTSRLFAADLPHASKPSTSHLPSTLGDQLLRSEVLQLAHAPVIFLELFARKRSPKSQKSRKSPKSLKKMPNLWVAPRRWKWDSTSPLGKGGQNGGPHIDGWENQVATLSMKVVAEKQKGLHIWSTGFSWKHLNSPKYHRRH